MSGTSLATGATGSRVAPLDAELVRQFDRSGPRYTSYPTAVEFHAGVGEAEYLEHLVRADEREPGDSLSLYVHIPFCAQLCSFCACHFIATPRREVATNYLGYLGREIELLAGRLPARRTLTQLQWGGGTPTYLAPAELEELFVAITSRFQLAPGAEVAIEVDPRVTTREHLETLARLGFTRLSMGVQDFTPEVQEAIGRRQTFEQTTELVDTARQLGFSSSRGGINFDLVYGLPRQTEESFARSLDRVVALRPDRIALYSFAFVPWARPHQKRIDAATLPASEEKLALALAARERLLEAGYEAIGMDHFALPSDELAEAARAARLGRNFMGYTVNPASALVALGTSGIGEVEGAYFQNERRLASYYRALDEGRLPIERGYRLDDDDRLRRHVIQQLMCNFTIDKRAVERQFDIDFDAYFSAALAQLAVPEGATRQRLVVDEGSRLTVPPERRLFVRNACMAFDRYLPARQAAGKPVFSRTV